MARLFGGAKEPGTPVPMRELLAAFDGACKDVLVQAGWKKRSGRIYTLALAQADCFAWLGLNIATKYYPLQVNPVVGIRNEELDRTVRALLPARSGSQPVSATLVVPVGYLTPEKRHLTLDVATPAAAVEAAAETERLVRTFGLPLAERLAPRDALLEEFQNHTLPTVNRGEYDVPVLLALLDQTDEAKRAVDRLLATENRQQGAIRGQDEHFAAAFATWVAQREKNLPHDRV